MRIRNFHRWRKTLTVALGMAALAGCMGSRGGPIPYEVENFAVPDPAAPVIPGGSYALAPGDKLQITVFRVEDLTSEYMVDLAGNVRFPLIGTVTAVGRTPEQLAEDIAMRLNERYLRDPKVTVAVTESIGRNVTVDGSVREPGVYPVTDRMTLIEAVAKAKGTDEYANPRRIAVFRQIEGQRMAAAFDLVSIRRGEAPDPEIYPGDVVVVEGNTTRRLLQQILGTLPVISLFVPVVDNN